MKLKIFATISYKNKTFIVSLFLIYAMLLNSYAGLNYTEIKINKKKLTTTITPSIAAAADELFLGEQTVITFEGFDGDPLHTFTYTLNGGSDETISTTNDENSVTLNTSIISLGTFTYTLIKVEDSFGNIEIVDQDLTITVTDPPTISFVFTNDGACSNETIDFTSSVSGDGPFSYKWDFGDGNTSTDENPSHAYNTTGNIGLQDFSVKLLVTDNNTRASSVSEVVSIQNIPNISFFSGGSLKNCAIQEDGFDVEFFNSSQSSSDITSYTFDWGDGSSETISGADFPVNSNGISHTFEIGVFTVVISAKNSDGCSNEVEFDVIYGNDPGGGLQAPPNTAGICFPTEELDFGIVGWGKNSKETIYELDFGDGTIVNYTQTLLENSSSYNATDPSKSSVFSTLHIYTSGSCSEVNGEFIVKLTITNACNNKISTANNVVILEPSVPLFEVDPVGCVNVPLEFDNQSIIGDDADCAENARFQWDWGDGNVQNFPPGSTADNQTHTYTAPGNYKVILSVFGVCDTDNTYERTICIEPEKEITASYILDFQEGCILPLAVSTENTIDESELCSGPTYNWTVTFEDINCNTLSDWEFTDSTNASSENPKFLFNNPGNYTITQNVTTGCGSFSTQKVITIKKPPTVSINPIDDFCKPAIISPVAVVENCTDNLGGVTYNWTFSGGTPATSTLQNPENISYDTEGTFTVTLEVTNECGVSNTATQQFEVLEKPIITNSPTTQEICSNQSTTPISLTASNTNSSFIWTATTLPNNPNITGFTSNGTSQVIPSQTIVNSGFTPGSIVYTVTPDLNGCLGDLVEVLTVIVNPTPIITTQPIPSNICLDGAANTLEIVTENGVGTPNYQWYASSTNTYDLSNPITGATNSTYDPATNTVGEVFYFVVISFDGGCSDIRSTITLVNTVAEPTANAVNPEQTICVDGQADMFTIDLLGGLGNPTFQWFSNTKNTNTGGTAISDATSNTYDSGVFSSIGTFYYYLEATLDGTGCDLASSDVFAVNVVADPVIDTQAIASQEICQNTTLEALEVNASGDGNTGDFSYQWFSNTTNTNSGGTAIASATSKVYNPDNITVGTFFYYVVIKQTASGCEVTSEVSTIIINEGPSITTQPIPSDICLDGAANVLEVVTQNGVGTPTYQWYSNTTNSITGATEVTGATNSTYTPPTDTVGEVFYFVIIAFDGGCSDIQSDIVLVKVNQIPVIDFAEITIYSEETFLFDPSSIASNIIPAGTTYTWTTPTSSTPGAILGSSAESSPQTNISQTLENTDIFPAIETYIITPATTNCAGNPFTLEVTVNPKIIPNVLVTNNTCFESNDGIITTNITGGVPFTTGTSYLISWTGPNSFTSTASSISNLIAGIYILRIEDSNGVFITEQYTVTQPDLLIITTDLEQNISCFEGSDGAIEVSASGGTLSYTFNWTTTDGTGIIQGNEGQSGLTAGTYNLELTDNNACVNAKTFILTEPKAIGSTVLKEDILCFGDATGAIEIAVTGGTPIEVSSGVFEYTYSWLGPNGFTSNVQNISNLFAGIYTIEITDNLGCIERTDIVLTEPTAIEINYTKTDIACYGETDGAIDVTISGGNPPYQISWSNLANGFSQSNLSAGSYVAKIVDENKCEANVTITIEQPIFFIEPIVIPISCNNENDGSIDLNLTGGIAPITVLWSDNPSAGLQRNNLSPGTYSVTITDSDPNQCPIQQTFLFTDPPAIGVSETITDATDCSIVNSGSILLDVSGGTPPYDFIWNTGQTTEDLTNIPPGDYSVEIKDKNNCIINKQFSIYRQEPIEIEFLVTEIPDCDLKTVSQRTVAKITGGISPYTYSWSAGSVSITDNTIMTTSQNGLYTLTITDDKGCTESKIFLVDLPTIGNADYSYDAFSIDNYNLLSIEDPIQFTNLTIGNYSNITWDFGDGSPTTSDENPVHIYDQVGVFNVVLKIELDFGCIAIIEKTLNITQGYVLINPNAFSPNNDGYNETIRPSFTGFKEIEMTIYDTWGVPIYYEKNLELNGWDGTIKGLPAENGNYVMVVKGNTFYEKEIITITALTLLK